MSTRVTNKQLRDLLTQLGFEQRESCEPKCAVFEHPKSLARLLLPANKDNNARAADVVSLRTHLLFRGHLTEAAFSEFLQSGRLKAS